MTTQRAALKRDLARHHAARRREGLAGPDTYRAREPYREIRPGQKVRARAGELFVVVVDGPAGDTMKLGHVRAGQGGLLELTEDAAQRALEHAASQMVAGEPLGDPREARADELEPVDCEAASELAS